MECWLVGGAVRDELLGLPVEERDWVVVGATPAELEARDFRPVGRDFPVFLHPETGEEYALARTERKSGHGHRGFVVHADPAVTLEEDLARRDLTVNAMARGPDGTLVDPWGGRADLEARLLRHVSPAFVEDPLRVLRVARFAARFAELGFRVADETMSLMATMAASGELDHLVPERVWQETERALAGPAPVVYFDTLAECGALAVLFAPLDRCWRASGSHARAALSAATGIDPGVDVRFAAMVHELEPDDELAGLCQRLRVPGAPATVADRLVRWLRAIDEAPMAGPEHLLEILLGLDVPRRPELHERVLRAWRATAEARGIDPEPALACLADARRAISAIRGGDLAAEGWGGPALGRELDRRRLAAIRAITGQGGSDSEAARE